MPFCKTTDVTVLPGRFRDAAITDKEVMELAESMRDLGQLQPILVTDSMELVDGLNRLRACELLDKDVWFENEESGQLMLNNPLLRRKAELQANIRRKGFTPTELARGIAEIDRLMKELYGQKKTGVGHTEGWTQQDTAEMLNYGSKTTVVNAILIDKAAQSGLVPGLDKAATMNEALKIVQKAIKVEAIKESAKRLQTNPDQHIPDVADPFTHFSSRIILGDALAEMKSLDAGICNLFITDPPFGIELDDSLAFRHDSPHDVYADDRTDILPLTKGVLTEMARVGKPDCHIFMFCGAEHWSDLTEHVKSLGFNAMRKPVLWVKYNQTTGRLISGRTNNPDMYFGSAYEVALFAWRGTARLFTPGVPDVFLHGVQQDKYHVAQKPVALLEAIIKCLWNPGVNTTLIDPFVGSGSTLLAAAKMGIKNYFGYEINADFRQQAISNLALAYSDHLRIVNNPVPEIGLNEEDL